MADRRRRKKDLGRKVNKQYRKQTGKAILSLIYGIITCVSIITMTIMEIMPETYTLNVGEFATETIKTPVEVEDKAETERQREVARESVADIYSADPKKTEKIVKYFEGTVFDGLITASEYGDSERGGVQYPDSQRFQYSDSDRVKKLSERELGFISDSPDMSISDAMKKDSKVIAVLDSDPEDVRKLKEWFLNKLPIWLETGKNGISEAQLPALKAAVRSEVLSTSIIENEKLKQVVAEVSLDKLSANGVVQEELTEEARRNAAKNVDRVMIPIGTEVVVEGDLITQEKYDILYDAGVIEKLPYALLFGSAGSVLLMLLVIVLYIKVFEPKLTEQPKKVLLLCILILVNVIISLLLKSREWQSVANAAMCSILVAMLFNEQIALIVNTAISVILAMLISTGENVFSEDVIAVVISSLVGGTAAIYVCKNVRKSSTRAKMLIPGVVSGLVSMVVAFAVMCASGREVIISARMGLYCLAGGGVTAIFTAGSLSLWESMFGLITQSKLLELSNSSSDLLRKISLEIPGTYQHSTTVAELSENGAKDIGADPMLARAAALYHDIGKLRCPECYTENQTLETKGFHNTLSPEESKNMIFSHITEGVQIAKANKLPAEIIDVIQQHHGTSAVMYFYNKARAADPSVRIDEFRYPGPNPLTKESGIIMLADCVEASVRSLDEKTHDTIAAQIEKMFKARIDGGELDKSQLTLSDINVLKQSFLDTLTAVYHTRIKYDNGAKKE
jgi:putative nucleotidyltransferase with HDIG domain